MKCRKKAMLYIERIIKIYRERESWREKEKLRERERERERKGKRHIQRWIDGSADTSVSSCFGSSYI